MSILGKIIRKASSLLHLLAATTRPAGGEPRTTFLALEAADPALSAYFDGCRIKRNSCEYDFAGGISDTDADGLLKAVRQFAIDAEAWIYGPNPTFEPPGAK